MKKYVVKVIAVSGKNNKIHKYGDIVNDGHFPNENIETLVEKGYLELSKDSKNANKKENKAAAKVLEKELEIKVELYSELKSDFDLLEKPTADLDSFQILVDEAQIEFNNSVKAVNLATDKVQNCQVKLQKAKTEPARQTADEKLNTAKKAFAAAKKSNKELSEAHEATIEDLTNAHNRLKIYTDLEREVNIEADEIEDLKGKIKKLKK